MNYSIKIISDGSSNNTHVYNNNGDELKGITDITFNISAGCIATATIKFMDIKCEVIAAWEHHPLKQWANRKIGAA